ncbi:MFS transporter [uncultured Roseobacter sp.]|uniref:MFS transporter n=1 Tax=uncultured Roseobacter sp. TaxID=114847 RepID=UPI0026392106|nr:MFS transporter [uncultured Roseobacter sp.]
MSLINDIKHSRKPLAGFLVIGCAWATCFAQMPAIKAGIGASDAVLGTAILVSSMGALAAMWLAPFADRVAGRWAMPVFAGAVGAGMIGAGAATEVIAFTLGMLLAATGSGVVDVLVNVRVSEIEARTGRKLMNLNHALYSFTYAGAALATGAFRELGWTPLQVFTLLGAVVAVLAWMTLEARTPPEMETEIPQGAAMPHGLVWLAGLLVMVAFLSEASAEGWSALHLERTLGGGAAEGALGPAILGLTMGIGRLAGHIIAHRVTDTVMMVCALLLSGFGLALAGAAPTLGIAYLGFGLGGLGISVLAPVTLALVGRIVPPKARLAAISRASVLGYGAFFLGPPLMGFTSELFGLRAAFFVIAAILIIACATIVPALARGVRRNELTV